MGTADDQPDHGRWYGDIIRRLVDQGLVVHSHFHDLEEFGLSLQPYRDLAEELDDYHCHPTVSHRRGTQLSDLISRYDLMGVFHELGAAEHNESATLAVCMPTKSVCGWMHGGIPVVCFPHYRGIVERIERHGVGFVVDDLDGVAAVAADREAVAAATERALAFRHELTTEHTAARIRDFVGAALRRRGQQHVGRHLVERAQPRLTSQLLEQPGVVRQPEVRVAVVQAHRRVGVCAPRARAAPPPTPGSPGRPV